ncbi:hypothetical protein [Terrihabitans sp. B22-R8]|uniref:hypothetical protein n=1 Tax=Terrihabitans sp. B22-R8 TaxID=3425128 RepID=UPI00403CCB1E
MSDIPTSANFDRANELVPEITMMIVNSGDFAERPWDSLALTVIVQGGSVQMSGYTYEDGASPEPATPRNVELARKFRELAAAMQKPDGGTWVSSLIQVRRDSQKVHIDFDYENPGRWKVTPANLKSLPEEIRPK